MIRNLIPLFYSAFYMFIVIVLGLVLAKTNFFSKETSRKIIHIGVSLWWFTLYFINNIYMAIFLPIVFTFLNSIVAFNPKLAAFLNFTTDKERNRGLIYFPVGMAILVYLYYSGYIKFDMGAIAMLVLGFGDASAAIIGTKYGHEKINLFNNKSKSIIGSLMMFVSSASIMAMYLNYIGYNKSNIHTVILIFITSIFATISEFFGKKGLDNVTIVGVVTLCVWLLW